MKLVEREKKEENDDFKFRGMLREKLKKIYINCLEI